MPFRIAVGGIGHESNTFNPVLTSINSFNILKGNELLFEEPANYLRSLGIEVVPTIYAKALPSGIIEKEAYDRLKNELLTKLQNAGKIDGMCLVLHGAMEVEGIGDGERDLVKSIREIIGEEPIISSSLDLHGNLNPEFVEECNILTAYRTAPHVDVQQTRIRSAKLLLKALKRKLRPLTKIVKPPVLLPGELVVTEVEPARSLYSNLERLDKNDGILNSSLLVGMAWADSPYARASALVVAENEKFEDQSYCEAEKLAWEYWKKRREFHYEVDAGPVDDLLNWIKKFNDGPIFISDSGDNVTAGAPGDLPIIVERLLDFNLKDVVVGGIFDPEAVNLCREAGINKEVELELGGKIDSRHGSPLPIKGEVLNLTKDGAVLRAHGIDIIITNKRIGWTTLEAFIRFGINPSSKRVVVVKLGYLTPDFRKIAKASFLALTPGCTNQLLHELTYVNVKRPLYPLDKDFSWTPGFLREET